MSYDFRKYKGLKRAGLSPVEVRKQAQADSVSDGECIGLLRRLYKISFEEAKSVLLTEAGTMPALSRRQSALKEGLESALIRVEDEEPSQ